MAATPYQIAWRILKPMERFLWLGDDPGAAARYREQFAEGETLFGVLQLGKPPDGRDALITSRGLLIRGGDPTRIDYEQIVRVDAPVKSEGETLSLIHI